MAITRGNTSTGSNFTGATTTSLATASSVLSSGESVKVGFGFYDPTGTITVSGVADTAGNTYTHVETHYNSTSDQYLSIWECLNATGHASNVVTVTVSSAVGYWGVVTQAYAGLHATSDLDTTAEGEDNASQASVVSNAFTTTVADAVIVGVSMYDGATGDTWFADTGYTIRIQDASQVVMLQDQIVSAIQTSVTLAAFPVQNTSKKIIVVGAFKAASVGGTVVPVFMNQYRQRRS